MSSARQRVAQAKSGTLPGKTTPEQRYWRTYTSPQLVKESHAISHIHFNPASPYDFAVSLATRVQVYSAKTRQVVKTFSRFKDTVFSAEFRPDGKLLLAADASGLVSIYDAYLTRNLLVSLNPSSHPTRVAKFHPSTGNHILTASDDRLARLYDISQTASGPIASFGEGFHKDYVRSAAFIPDQPHLVSTGCYDGIVRVFDSRVASSSPGQCIAQFDQQNPVEDILAISPTTLVLAGGPQVKVWDVLRGHQLHELNNFTKTATCLHDAGLRGLLVGSLDGHVKVFDYTTSNWDVKFGWRFGSGGVLTCAVSPAANDHRHFVTGLTSGLLSVRTKKTDPKVPQGVKKEKLAAYGRMMRGRDYTGEEEFLVVHSATPQSQSKKLKPFEKHLNAFRWLEALDSAISPNVQREITVTVLQELKRRGKVRTSLYGRDEISLVPVLLWLTKNLADVRSNQLVSDYIGAIVEIYGPLVDKSVVLEEAFATLVKAVSTEIKRCKEASEITGMLELLTV